MQRFEQDLVRALPRLRGVARRLTGGDRALADDLVQDTCVNALRARDRFELGTDMDAWLATILRNRFFSLLKRHGRRFETGDDERLGRMTAGTVPQLARLDLMALDEALAELRPVERSALMCAATEDVSYDQIATASHCAVGTVKSRISRARSQLAHALGRGEAERPSP